MPISADIKQTELEAQYDVVELTRKLVNFNTLNPPGDEVEICDFLEQLFKTAGFSTEVVSFGDKRRNLVAKIGGFSNRSPLGITGHMDTVPLGAGDWEHDPFAGVIQDNRIYGRGTCDMKGGIAAAICAALSLGDTLKDGPGLTFFITGGEETGSDGARHLVRSNRSGRKIGALVVAEPTDLLPLSGHKGVFWLKAVCKGRTAHGSMPEQGESAILKATAAIQKLQQFCFETEGHEHLGQPTLNVGTMKGGINTNSVADHAEFTIDLRTLPDQRHGEILDRLRAFLGDNVSLEPMVDLPGVWTRGDEPWFASLEDQIAPITGQRLGIATAPYFTDASVLTPHYDGVPTVILGPGSPKVAHTVDEYCEVSQLKQAVEIYRTLILDWYKQGRQ